LVDGVVGLAIGSFDVGQRSGGLGRAALEEAVGERTADNYEAVDTMTGTVYPGHQNGQVCPGCPPGAAIVKTNGSFTGPQVEFTMDQEFGLESHGSEPNVFGKSKLHVTINANGDVTASVSDFSLTCQRT